ncbi:MAG TPA: transglycosylase SLT domain-containing protein [Anaerolineaceae bacterium]|nr:transglycosylase SLT domain-containing protein [Anaerolineaceae bacterium]
MQRAQLAVLPGVAIGSLLVVWIGLTASGWFSRDPEIKRVDAAPAAVEGGEAADVDAAADPSGNTCQVSTSYPESVLRWCDLIGAVAGDYGLDPDLVAAVMLQESGGDPQVLSASGAVGLLQVMPSDGLAAKFECINGPCFAARPTIQELGDPEFNLRFGARMLAGLFERTGDWRETLKRYGPMDVGYDYADLVLQIYQNYASPDEQGG